MFTGTLDELRISSVARSADWIATEYNNQSSPSSFATIGGSPYFCVSTTTLPQGIQNSAYSVSLATQNGTSPLAWSVISGALPAGLSLDSTTGVISGAPTGLGTSAFTVQVVDTNSNVSTRGFSLTVNAQPLSVTTTSLVGNAIGVSYSANLGATGGVPPYNWSISSGALPNGLALDPSSGSISGNASATGTFHFTVQVTDTRGVVATQALGISVFRIDSLTPSAAALRGTIVINCAGVAGAPDVQVFFNGSWAAVTGGTDTSLTVGVPGTATSGPVTVQAYGATSPGLPFTVEGQPTVTALSPNVAPVGATVTISGSGFGPQQSSSTVQFNGGTATVTSWSDTQIEAVVPSGASTGPVSVTVAALTAQGPQFSLNSSVQVTDSAGNLSTYTSQVVGGK